MKQTSWITDNIKAVLALLIVTLGFGYFFMCSIRNLKPDPQILIAFVSSIGVCIGYYFGSSSKTDKADATPTILQTGDSPTAGPINTPEAPTT